MKPLNDLQERVLTIYKNVKSICEAEGIRFYAIGGTAIGAVRHHGFIPWDDDLDIAMPIEDYNRFITASSDALNDGLELVVPTGSPHYESVFCKVVDSNTTVIQRNHRKWPDRFSGAWIDIMPMSGVPSEGIRREWFIHKLWVLLALHQYTREALPEKLNHRQRAAKIGAAPLRSLGRSGVFYKQYYDTLLNHPFDKARYCGYTWSFMLSKLIFPKQWFEDYVEMPFEDTVMRLPIGWDDYLSQQFGDYLVIPDDNERVDHDVFVDLETPYREYASGNRKNPQ